LPNRSFWGFPVAAQTGDRNLVDATEFFVRDVTGSGSALRPGNYRVDRGRSTFYLPNTKGFPKNTEIDVTLTFANDAAGGRGGGGGPAQGPEQIGGRAGGAGGGGGRGGGLFSGSVASVTPSPDSGDDARARFAGRIAGQQLQAALGRPARRLLAD
jgi:hypothetical protein